MELKIENCKMKIANWRALAALNGRFVRVTTIRGRLAQTGQDVSFIAGAPHFRPIQTGSNRLPNLQFAFFNWHFSVLFSVALCALLFALCSSASAQTIVDKTVASVTNGARATPDRGSMVGSTRRIARPRRVRR